MDLLLIAVVAAFASFLTFFSGFGLGTILTPVFILFFPVDLAIALTGVVHFLNNIFKIGLIGKHASMPVVLKFGLPAILSAFLGAWLLFLLSGIPIYIQYKLFGYHLATSPVNIIIALLLIFFAIFEIIPTKPEDLGNKRNLTLGGILSGFFGGLSGHQGALRSAFLIRYGLGKEAFIATGIIISSMIDVSRLSVYWSNLNRSSLVDNWDILTAGVLAAFLGAFVGRQLLRKLTLRFVQYVVAIMIAMIALLLGFGVI
jgi:uncharacterized membrane protein YfcA